MLCGGPKMSPRTSSIVQITFFVWSFEISEGINILRNQKLIIGLDSFSNQYICLRILPMRSRAFLAGTARQDREKNKAKSMIVSLCQDDRLKTRSIMKER